jgi:hypothetical protein
MCICQLLVRCWLPVWRRLEVLVLHLMLGLSIPPVLAFALSVRSAAVIAGTTTFSAAKTEAFSAATFATAFAVTFAPAFAAAFATAFAAAFAAAFSLASPVAVGVPAIRLREAHFFLRDRAKR